MIELNIFSILSLLFTFTPLESPPLMARMIKIKLQFLTERLGPKPYPF
jgi:hypothetical protein